MEAFNSPSLAPPFPALSVIPAKAGIHAAEAPMVTAEWIPAFAGMTAACGAAPHATSGRRL